MLTPSLVEKDNSVLHARAKAVTEFGTKELRTFLEGMKETMRREEGIGLAAPQMGESLQVFVIAREHIKEVDEMNQQESTQKFLWLKNLFRREVPEIYINPEILWFSQEKVSMEEGCLSIPGLFGSVSRPREIVIEARNEKGRKYKLKARGLLAKVLQHETDHLNGILFVEKAEKDTLHKIKE